MGNSTFLLVEKKLINFNIIGRLIMKPRLNMWWNFDNSRFPLTMVENICARTVSIGFTFYIIANVDPGPAQSAPPD